MKLHTITIGNEQLPILVRRHASSRRIVIRYQPRQHAVGLTLPRYVSLRQGLHFVEEKRDWIARQLSEKQRRITFVDGQLLPFLGERYCLRHAGGRGVIRIEDGNILVPGEAAFMERRVKEWLRSCVREEIIRLADEKARMLGVKPKRISLRDTSSRWGSCSHDGNLSFSWRLVFAPYAVLDYLVSHEVAHLAQHNHSPAFWALVAKLHPDFDAAQAWLKTHGQGLHSYG